MRRAHLNEEQSDGATLRKREKEANNGDEKHQASNIDHKWQRVSYQNLPKWLRDNEFLIFGHRPPLNTFVACLESIFRIHTETVNIWTHLLGFLMFIGIAVQYIIRPCLGCELSDQMSTLAFFAGAITCLGFSWLFHTVKCHSEDIGRFFHKLDHCGIVVLIMGSFVPCLHFSFYCHPGLQIFYLGLIFSLGAVCLAICLLNRFSTPAYRPLRAAVFIALGLSGIFPSMQTIYQEGFYRAIHYFSVGWLALMGALYIVGAVIYALRFPERMFPGKFDIWFQSHQIFHVFVVIAALVHFYGVSIAAQRRQELGPCPVT